MRSGGPDNTPVFLLDIDLGERTREMHLIEHCAPEVLVVSSHPVAERYASADSYLPDNVQLAIVRSQVSVIRI